jgi:SAM-dependent methyltransferase
MLDDFVSLDGSPLAVYLAMPAGDAPFLVHGAIRRSGSVLELGSGPGRVTRVLAALGHPVVAVDDSKEMLAHVTGAEVVCADVQQLELGRQFDAVLLGSTLINSPSASRRRALLEVCRRHVDSDGVVLIERYQPGWLLDTEHAEGMVGPVEVEFDRLEWTGTVVSARMTYRLAERVWSQPFQAMDMDDVALAAEAAATGLRIDRWLDDARTWGLLRSE